MNRFFAMTTRTYTEMAIHICDLTAFSDRPQKDFTFKGC